MKLEKLVNSGIPIICGALLTVIVVVTFAQIVLRNIFDSGLPWYDDVSQFSMSWMVLFGTIWLTKNNQHLNTGFKVHRKFNEWQSCLIDSILDLTIIGIAVIIVYQSAIFVFTAIDIGCIALPWLKIGYVFIMLPLAMLSVCYYYLKSFLQRLERIFKKD